MLGWWGPRVPGPVRVQQDLISVGSAVASKQGRVALDSLWSGHELLTRYVAQVRVGAQLPPFVNGEISGRF